MTEQRLHIPLIFGFDVIHGFDTEFPVPIATAASWDPAQAEHGQAIAAEEAMHAGHKVELRANAGYCARSKVGRHLGRRWAKIHTLGAAMARAQVRGFQGNDRRSRDCSWRL